MTDEMLVSPGGEIGRVTKGECQSGTGAGADAASATCAKIGDACWCERVYSATTGEAQDFCAGA